MSDIADLLPRMRSAYEIFSEELEKHLEFLIETKQVLATKTEAAEIEEVFRERAKGLEQRFHVFKGGAGFLKLQKIAALSDTFEKVFKKGEVDHPDKIQLQAEFSATVEQLEAELISLRELLEQSAPADS